MTEAEKKLWYQYLRTYPLKFLRQKVIENYILDFYCSICRLCVEIDGGQHFTSQGVGHDTARTELLNAYGIMVLRFSNEQVQNEFFQVCRRIDDAVKELISRHLE